MLNRKDGSLITIFAFYLTLYLDINCGINKTKQAFFNHPDSSSESGWYPLTGSWLLLISVFARSLDFFWPIRARACSPSVPCSDY